MATPLDQVRYFLITRKNGDVLCKMKQLPKYDPIGEATKENMSINRILIMPISPTNFIHLECKYVPAKDLNTFLNYLGVYPY